MPTIDHNGNFIATKEENAAERRIYAEHERYREALEMIAGLRRCPDSLLGNADIARLALESN